MDTQKLSALTQEYCGEWGTKHAERLIDLVETIGSGIKYSQSTTGKAGGLIM